MQYCAKEATMKLPGKWIAVLICTLVCGLAPAQAAEVAPDVLVKSTVEDVLSVIKQNKDRQALRRLAQQKVVPYFDFRRMTQLAVGTAWREASAGQQQELESGFRILLVNTYTTALSMAGSAGQNVDVRPLQIKEGQHEVTVRTSVKDGNGQPVAIDYRMARTPDGWKVFDVIVENLSLVTNCRSTFAAEVGKSGIDGLIKALAEKNRARANS
jgi:phospholipid transport system substrate-binding protein